MRGRAGVDAGSVARSSFSALLTILLLACASAFAGPATASASARPTRTAARCRKPHKAHARKHHRAICAKRTRRRATHRRAVRRHKRRPGSSIHSHSGRRSFSTSQRPHGGHRGRARSSEGGLGPAPAPGPGGNCPDADLMPEAANLERIRTATLCLVNRERARDGEALLHQNGDIQRAAQLHSAEMAARDYFEHEGPGGDTPVSRLRASGYIYSSRVGYAVGENIAWGTLNLATPRAIVASWMASPEHRANILDARYRDSAIGVAPHPLASLAEGQPGAIYTQDFGVIITG